jgi:hypothetical protein
MIYQSVLDREILADTIFNIFSIISKNKQKYNIDYQNDCQYFMTNQLVAVQEILADTIFSIFFRNDIK